jgi:acetyltransferase
MERSYPTHYTTSWALKDGTPVSIRPIHPDDEAMMVIFHSTLSDESVHSRYFGIMKLSQRVEHKRLSHICADDDDQEIALVADYKHPDSDQHEILGVARLCKIAERKEAEFAFVIADKWQGFGLGTQFLTLLVDIARKENIHRIIAYILPENPAMQRVFKKLGFKLHHDLSKGEVTAELLLLSL